MLKRVTFSPDTVYQTPQPNFFFKFRQADKKIQLISGLAEYSRNLRNFKLVWNLADK